MYNKCCLIFHLLPSPQLTHTNFPPQFKPHTPHPHPLFHSLASQFHPSLIPPPPSPNLYVPSQLRDIHATEPPSFRFTPECIPAESLAYHAGIMGFIPLISTSPKNRLSPLPPIMTPCNSRRVGSPLGRGRAASPLGKTRLSTPLAFKLHITSPPLGGLRAPPSPRLGNKVPFTSMQNSPGPCSFGLPEDSVSLRPVAVEKKSPQFVDDDDEGTCSGHPLCGPLIFRSSCPNQTPGLLGVIGRAVRPLQEEGGGGGTHPHYRLQARPVSEHGIPVELPHLGSA